MNNFMITDTLNNAKDTLHTAMQDTPLDHFSFDLSRALEGNSIYISVIGYVVVFMSLLLLFIILSNLARILSINIRKKYSAEKGVATDDPLNIPAEVTAAIAMALYLHSEEVHDVENTILTIKKIQRPYSPWSSKIYGLREFPHKR